MLFRIVVSCGLFLDVLFALALGVTTMPMSCHGLRTDAALPHGHHNLFGPIINYVPIRDVVHYRSRAGNRYKCQSTEQDQ